MATGDIKKFGTLMKAGVKVKIPTNPTNDSGNDMTQYSNGQSLTIVNSDSDPAYVIPWVEIIEGSQTMYISDRCLLNYMCLDYIKALNLVNGVQVTIDGLPYLFKAISGGVQNQDGVENSSHNSGGKRPNEWDDYVCNAKGLSGLITPAADEISQTSAHNQKWHWYHMYSVCRDATTPSYGYEPLRGCSRARLWDYNYSDRIRNNYGLRAVLILQNSPPTISNSDGSLGSFAKPLVKEYSVAEGDGDFFSILEQLDGSTIRSLSNQRDGSYTIDLTSRWGSLALGTHTLKITATDTKNAASVRTWTFSKTNSPAGKPTITGLTNGRRIEQSLDITFSPATDPDGDAQTFAVEVASNSAFTSGKQTFTAGLKKYNATSKVWEDATVGTNADAGGSFKIPVSGLALNSDRYIRVSTIDKTGSGTATYSDTILVHVGMKLEIQSPAAPLDYQPTSCTPRFGMTVDPRATITVMVCNNALDTAPTWEDATAAYNANKPHIFTNKTKTANSWAVAEKLKIDANDSTGTIEVTAIGAGVM